MNIDVWTFRTSARRPFRSLALALSILALSALLAAQTLQPTAANGRIVWTNDGPPAPAASSPVHAAAATEQSPHLFYWSNRDRRWKPVRPATPRALRSAEVVAGEVSNFIESRPRLDSNASPIKGKLAAQDPNYSTAAGDRSVTAAQIDRYINDAAARHHVDPNLVRALVKVESNFNPHAVSSKGAMGLMQLMPATARLYDLRNPFDAAQNVEAGVRHLKGLLENFRGDVSLSLAAYNAGQGAVERSRGIPPYTETRNYVRRITSLMGSGSPVTGSDSSELRLSSVSLPIQVRRNERGQLVISDME
jgi:soluble lytic murein transglycosylase-like protein